ncbi:hypothetical protein SAMN06297229_0957 [Pseudidiomarina planktonica]|uniref:Uncharacterized protein n=1 Tax=Pseudidiomarina planktonica TaxID=1323738 RepID=A0A1Y6EN34_9GAMM|nr:hypothetical protein [Pseudidiomarina planktonica]SMQ64074.1 hypothetical protein SAMN06297229_0957 [Pseudidiomarina planktonica]
MVEMLILTSTLLTVFIASVPFLSHALTINQLNMDSARARLWQPVLLSSDSDNELRVTSNYQLSTTVGQVLRPLTRLTSLQLPFENLYSTKIGSGDNAKLLVRLFDDWSASVPQGLVTEPAKLIPLGYLNNAGIRSVQNIAGWLPNTRELASDQLQLGYVNDQVVPQHALCGAPQSCR